MPYIFLSQRIGVVRERLNWGQKTIDFKRMCGRIKEREIPKLYKVNPTDYCYASLSSAKK